MSKIDTPGAPPDRRAAAAMLADVHARPTIANVTRAHAALAPNLENLAAAKLRLACLASFTFDPIKPALTLQALRAGIAANLYVAPFGQYERELIDPESGLAAFGPQTVVVAVRLADACPAVYDSFNALTADHARGMIDDWHARLRAGLAAFRVRCAAPILIQNYDQPATPALGVADHDAPLSQSALIAQANAGIRALAGSMDNVFVMDYDGLVAAHGRRNWADPRTAFFARIPVAPENYWRLAGFYVRHLRPLLGLSRKVLVLDADNTLWGGVVGDVGLDGIALGHDYPGNAYVAFQKRILDLHRRGVVLCLASKNEPGTVEEVLASHPEMVLRAEHFAARRVDWDPKPDNLRAMAAELNLDLDSFVFVDDSPVECELMRTALPEVLTVPLPADPAEFPGVIEDLDCFDQWRISEEDRARGALYRAEAERRTLQSAAVDMPTFYRQLDMTMTLFVDHAPHAVRAAQMTNRTNQFNMHTLRCGEDDIRRFMADAEARVVTLALRDRFGDNGVVGLAVARCRRDEWLLHLFLMSCRILGRTVEQTFIDWIASQARDAGASRVLAEFVPTTKNKPFAGFYESCGFTRETADGTIQRWARPLADPPPPPPDWMRLVVESPAPGPGTVS